MAADWMISEEDRWHGSRVASEMEGFLILAFTVSERRYGVVSIIYRENSIVLEIS
jgi:hypothetical protein